MMVYLLRGKLPWLCVGPGSRPLGRPEVADRKRASGVEELCRRCPGEFESFLRHCRGLRFDEAPDYGLLRQLLRSALGVEAPSAPLDGGACGDLGWWLTDE